MVERAEKVAAGERPLKKDRFVSFTDSSTSVNWELVERARSLKGIKGYVTNIDAAVMDGPAVVAAYHDLYQVERSFRMTRSGLAARPVFHRLEDSIQAHLTVVFAALAVSREAQTRSGLSINKILKTLRPLRSATVTSGRRHSPPRSAPARPAVLPLASPPLPTATNPRGWWRVGGGRARSHYRAGSCGNPLTLPSLRLWLGSLGRWRWPGPATALVARGEWLAVGRCRLNRQHGQSGCS